VEIRQGAAEKYVPELYVAPHADGVAAAVRQNIARLQKQWPGVAVRESGAELGITVPERYRVGHEAHFAQVTRQFFEYLKNPRSMPAWEKPGMAAKYYVSTTGVQVSKAGSRQPSSAPR
jgi:hypothetical protein